MTSSAENINVDRDTLYPTDLSSKFEPVGGSEYHILEGIKEIKEALAEIDEANGATELQDKLNWVITQLGNFAYTSGTEISEVDIEKLVDERVAEREWEREARASYY